MNISQCEFCGRSNYLSDDLSCKGCGAPIPVPAAQTPTMLCDPLVFEEVTMSYLGRPGVNIPVNIPQRSRISDFISAGATVGASMFGRF